MKQHIDKLNRLSESHGPLQPGKGMASGVIALMLASTLYDFLSSGVVRYSGKWKASTPSKQSAASIRAITPEAIPLPG